MKLSAFSVEAVERTSPGLFHQDPEYDVVLFFGEHRVHSWVASGPYAYTLDGYRIGGREGAAEEFVAARLGEMFAWIERERGAQ